MAVLWSWRDVRVHGEDTGILELHEFGKVMPWHVCVHATVPRSYLELLKWKLVARQLWRDDDR